MSTASCKPEMLFLIIPLLIMEKINANSCSQKYYETIRRGTSSAISNSALISDVHKLVWIFPLISHTEGPSLSPEEIISSYHVDNRPVLIECSLLCKNEPKCVGFNYRITIVDIENCQLTNITENKNPENSGEWTLLRDRNVVNKVWIYLNLPI